MSKLGENRAQCPVFLLETKLLQQQSEIFLDFITSFQIFCPRLQNNSNMLNSIVMFKFSLKPNYLFKSKFDSWINLNMLISMVMLFLCFIRKVTFLGKFGPKIRPFKLKFGTEITSDLRNLMMMMFVSFVLDYKYPFR